MIKLKDRKVNSRFKSLQNESILTIAKILVPLVYLLQLAFQLGQSIYYNVFVPPIVNINYEIFWLILFLSFFFVTIRFWTFLSKHLSNNIILFYFIILIYFLFINEFVLLNNKFKLIALATLAIITFIYIGKIAINAFKNRKKIVFNYHIKRILALITFIFSYFLTQGIHTFITDNVIFYNIYQILIEWGTLFFVPGLYFYYVKDLQQLSFLFGEPKKIREYQKNIDTYLNKKTPLFYMLIILLLFIFIGIFSYSKCALKRTYLSDRPISNPSDEVCYLVVFETDSLYCVEIAHFRDDGVELYTSHYKWIPKTEVDIYTIELRRPLEIINSTISDDIVDRARSLKKSTTN